MKNLKYFIGIIFLVISVSSYSQLKVNSSGRVGIGGLDPDATYKLSLNSAVFVSGYTYPNLIISGDPTNAPYGRAIYPSSNNTCKLGLSNLAFNGIWTYSLTNLSDGRQKENVKDITDALGIILKLKGVKYDLKKEFSYVPEELNGTEEISDLEALRKNKVGFIAQDVYSVLPEVVKYDKTTDVYGINYAEIVPVLVEAMKEQQAQIEGLKTELASCCQNNLKSGSITSSINGLSQTGSEAKLYQNNPNPFSVQTTIRFELPESATSAQLHICNMTGTLLKTITVTQRSTGNITINANEFVAGMYLYSLICDGKIVDTKQMILTE